MIGFVVWKYVQRDMKDNYFLFRVKSFVYIDKMQFKFEKKYDFL